ncbi:hypothetical protein [Treponema pedis]|uniref:hypothetical protein n=1 Tax=Treponema pedis TaxID=409322 RepID=UPI0003F56153|nr:hypothetical protein [Treponema pedis]
MTNKKLLLLLITTIYIIFNLSAETITEEFVNKASGKTIIYKGEDYRGEGTFFLKNEAKLITIVTTEIRYGPMVNWFGNDIAEIFIPHGNPFNSSFLFNTRTLKLSDMLNNLIAVFPEQDIVVYTDFENFYFARVNSQEILQKIHINGIEGSYMALRHYFNILIQNDVIKIGVKYEPYTYKDLETYKYYDFKKEF